MLPVTVLNQGNDQGCGAERDGTQERNHGQQNGRNSQQYAVGQADQQKRKGIKNAVADSHQDLSAKKRDQIIVDRIQHEYQFRFETRIGQRQVIGPARRNAAFFQQEIKGVNWDQSESGQN